MSDESYPPIPITILSGFLGAGKTTLLNHILHGDHGLRVAVLVNDFGAVNIDAQLVVGVQGETVNLSNGCICCTIRDDLLKAVLDLLERPDRPDYILIETSGVSDPVPVALTFMVPPARALVTVDSILTVVDAENLLTLQSENAVLAMDQIYAADMVVINKVDLLTASQLEQVRQHIRHISPKARLFETTFGQIPLALALGVGRFDPAVLARAQHDIHVHPAHDDHHHDDHHHDDHHHHDHSLVFSTWSMTTAEPFVMRALREAVLALPLDIYRAKGFVYLADIPERRGILHMVGKRVRLTLGDLWGETPPQTQLVVIGAPHSVDAPALRRHFEQAQARHVAAEPPTETPSALEWLRGLLKQYA